MPLDVALVIFIHAHWGGKNALPNEVLFLSVQLQFSKALFVVEFKQLQGIVGAGVEQLQAI